MAAEDRLRWRCRRGTRELDLMLERYLERGWPRAGAAERAAFERLLDVPDPELHALLTGAAAAAEPELARLLARMRADGGAPAVACKVELEAPDGRPLHGYQCTGETFGQLEDTLKQSLVVDASLYGMAREFVFWAAEHIRLRFPGGKLTWKFVFDGLGMSGDHALGKRLVERGLQEWGREVVELNAGRKMYLYSLMHESGVPDALLQEESLYRKTVIGLVGEIERERSVEVSPYLMQMASRWAKHLPQTFHGEDFVRLLVVLAQSLVDLRAKLPEDLPEGTAQRWLDRQHPGWEACLPLRMTPQAAETLIRPALEAQRADSSLTSGPVLSRELRHQSDVGKWLGYLIFNDAAWLPSQMLPPNVQELKLWLLPTGAHDMHVRYYATPEEGGWQLRRSGGTKISYQFSLHEEFALTARADNRFVGEVIVDPGLPLPKESPSFWRSANKSDESNASCLVPIRGKPRTRALQIWLLTARNIDPVGGTGLIVEESEETSDGRLWRISGCGELCVGSERYFVRTGAEEESWEARMFLVGDIVLGWRRGGSVPVYRGACRIFGLYDSDRPRVLCGRQLRRVSGGILCSEVAEWVEESETLARIQYICLPADVCFQLRENEPGKVLFNAKGLENGWIATLQVADIQVTGSVENGCVFLELNTLGAVPGLVNLKLYDPSTGKVLSLQATWPTQKAMLLDPQGRRLKQNESISIDALSGWRAVVPNRARGGDLQLELAGHRLISLPVEGEVSLATNSPLIRAMLAQGGLDAQVNVNLHVGGVGSERLEIRRYHDRATVTGDTLQVRLDRDKPEIPASVLSSQLRNGCVQLHAVNINAPEKVEFYEDIATFNLRALLGSMKGPWLIQTRFNGRVQRPVVWGPNPRSTSSREALIQTYAKEWHKILSVPQDRKWDMWWNLMESARKGGDMGALYQVQALAQVPSAAIALAMRVPDCAVPVVVDLDTTIPIFWPALPIAEFISAISAERSRQMVRLSRVLGDSSPEEIENFGDEYIVKRIRSILVLRPELAVHFGKAMIETGIIHKAIQFRECQESLSLCWRSKSKVYERLEQLSQQVARRCSDHLPAGVRCFESFDSPIQDHFTPHIRPLINAPFIVAKMAMGLHPAPNVDQRLALINLRYVDSAYFDDALPVALQLIIAEAS